MKILLFLILLSSFILSDEIPSLSIKELKNLFKVQKEVKNYPLEEQATALAVGFSESGWNYDADHQGEYSNICGNKPYWDDFLAEKNIPTNSLEACIVIYKHYKEKNNGSRFLALKDYKGIKNPKNYYIINSTLQLREIILQRLKND